MRGVHGILAISLLALVPEALIVRPILRWAGVTSTSSTRCVAEVSSPLRRSSMALEPPSGGDGVHVDDSSAVPCIPDAVGTASLQRRLNDVKKRESSYRPANSGSGKATAPIVRATERRPSVVRPSPFFSVWVLMFDSGPRSGAQRGLYCLWSNGLNSVVAFEERDGALRYALELKAQGLGLPGPTCVTVNDLQQFCRDHSFGLEVVPADIVPVAPDKNKNHLEFEHKAPKQGRRGRDGNRLFPAVSEEASVFTPEDVRKFRAKFERLYSQE